MAVFRGDRSILDQIWENVVLSMIGETFGVDSNEICGAVCLFPSHITLRKCVDCVLVYIYIYIGLFSKKKR